MNLPKKTLLIILFSTFKSFSQVGIGTTSPSSNSALDISSTNSGVLIPRLTSAQRNEIVPVSTDRGLLVYDTDVENFFFYNPVNNLWSSINTGKVTSIAATNYTLSSSDYGKVLDFTASSNITLTVPNTLPQGFQVSITQAGTGRIIFAGSGGMTINNRWGGTQTSGQWAKAGLEIRATNSAVLSGDVRQ
jgi:hypothetical protein